MLTRSTRGRQLNHTLAVVALSAIGLAGSAQAQVLSPATAPAYATIGGVALDSLHNDVLRGALLWVDGLLAPVFTDSLGGFHIDSVPPGTRRIHALHSMLDSIGIALQTEPLNLVAGQTLNLILSTPSVSTVLAMRCNEEERRVGPAALLGTVLFETNDSPVTGSEVILEWTELRVSGNRIQFLPVRRTAIVPESGRFTLCGLPGDLNGSLVAVKGLDSTGVVDVKLASLIGIVGFSFPDSVPNVAPATLASRQGNAVLTGRIIDPYGKPVSRARVAVGGDWAVALSDADGRFVLRNLRAGTRAVSVRRLGFEPTALPVSLRSRTPVDVTIKLEQFVVVLDTVRVTALRDYALARTGFPKRKQTGTGYYLTPDQIARRHAYDLPALLAMVPVLRRSWVEGRVVISGRSFGSGPGCVHWYVDGMPWIGGGVEEFIWPDEVAAAEVYSSSSTPAEFRRQMDDCATVVIWTKLMLH